MKPGPLRLRELTVDPPLLNASGAFDVSSPDPDWRQDAAACAPLGGYVTKTVTREVRAGNPPPWVALWEDERSLVNAVGLANPGISAALREWEPLAREVAAPIILSLGGSRDDLAAMVELGEAAPWIAAYELNLSCPNDALARTPLAADPGAVASLVQVLRTRTSRPLLVKLTACCSSIGDVARAAASSGADAVCAINSMPVRALDDAGRPLLGTPEAGLSGAALHPIALRCVAEAAAAVDVPVIGVGGVRSIASLRAMLAAGAQAVQVGTAAAMAPSLLRELAEALESRGDQPDGLFGQHLSGVG